MKKFVLLRNDAQTRDDLARLGGWGRLWENATWILLRIWNPAFLRLAQLPGRGAVLPDVQTSAARALAKLPAELRALVAADARTLYDALVDIAGEEVLE